MARGVQEAVNSASAIRTLMTQEVEDSAEVGDKGDHQQETAMLMRAQAHTMLAMLDLQIAQTMLLANVEDVIEVARQRGW